MKKLSVAEIELAQDAIGQELANGHVLHANFFADYDLKRIEEGFEYNSY